MVAVRSDSDEPAAVAISVNRGRSDSTFHKPAARAASVSRVSSATAPAAGFSSLPSRLKLPAGTLRRCSAAVTSPCNSIWRRSIGVASDRTMSNTVPKSFCPPNCATSNSAPSVRCGGNLSFAKQTHQQRNDILRSDRLQGKRQMSGIAGEHVVARLHGRQPNVLQIVGGLPDGVIQKSIHRPIDGPHRDLGRGDGRNPGASPHGFQPNLRIVVGDSLGKQIHRIGNLRMPGPQHAHRGSAGMMVGRMQQRAQAVPARRAAAIHRPRELRDDRDRHCFASGATRGSLPKLPEPAKLARRAP